VNPGILFKKCRIPLERRVHSLKNVDGRVSLLGRACEFVTKDKEESCHMKMTH